ncbi:protein kinase domain-containing protein, partial [Streptomyces sp. NPDC004285]
DDRSGPLGAVVDALTGGTAGMTADQVERELRRMAGGGAPRPEPGAAAEASARPRTAGDDDAGAGTAPAPSPRTGRRRTAPRRGPVLAAGIVGALLIAGAWTYQVVRDDGPGTGPEPGGVTSTAPARPGAGGVTSTAPARPGAGGGTVTPRP